MFLYFTTHVSLFVEMSGWSCAATANTFQGVKHKQVSVKETRYREHEVLKPAKPARAHRAKKPGSKATPFLVVSAIIAVMALVIFYLKANSITHDDMHI